MKLRKVRTLRKTHRYLGLLVGIQLLFWTVSGLYFAWNPLAKVRGEHLANPPETLADAVGDAHGELEKLIGPQDALAALEAQQPSLLELDGFQLRPLLGEPYWQIRYREPGGERVALVHARDGVRRDDLTAEEARAVAERDFAAKAPIRTVEKVEHSEPDGEYRGKPLPAWRVAFDHPTNTRIYVEAKTGQITARRNDTWRVFDFLWMFHILDFEARNDFNHWLLRILSVLGVVTVASGFALFVVTSKPVVAWRGRRARGSSA